jgi:cytochrome c oxidase cbb3-type subunit I
MKQNKYLTLAFLCFALPGVATGRNAEVNQHTSDFLIAGLVLMILLSLVTVLLIKVMKLNTNQSRENLKVTFINELDEASVDILIKARSSLFKKAVSVTVLLITPSLLFAQPTSGASPVFTQPGILITLVLIAIPLFLAVLFLFQKISALVHRVKIKQAAQEATALAKSLLEDDEIDTLLLQRKSTLAYVAPSFVKQTFQGVADTRGLISSVNQTATVSIVAEKKKQVVKRLPTTAQSSLILWYLGTAVFWLLFGTTVGEYLGIKFVAPDADSISWLSFGRLRPVHTNAVFWGWSSLAMIGLAYHVVPSVSNTAVASIKKAWVSLILINAAVIIGSLCLMAGINNGGGEYREYIWPVMALFGAGLMLTLINFLQTIAKRKSKEVYISNWYIVSALIFTITIAFIAYWPTWQNGLGETIVQGYYMHQGVGMWFMLLTLGLVYYFLPQQVNKPIYSYGLGIIAFWSQILFYTLIGTHHFVFSSIPWWLQTVAIVGSAGMIIPVVAGTTNFFMTLKGSWHKLSSSYTLPFFLVGIIFYFTGSLQGTAEAFRYTNLLWHFTDFTVAHSHLTMYGIIAFLLWGCIYVVVPRITGREPSQLLTGIHFWMAFIGLMFYTIPLMIGGTLKGMAWMEGRSFIESVTLMAPYWLWRAIGGTLMWISHIIFAINFYKMVKSSDAPDINKLAIEQLRLKTVSSKAY